MTKPVTLNLNRAEARLLSGACLTFAAVPFRKDRDELLKEPLQFNDRIFELLRGAVAKQRRGDEHSSIEITAEDLDSIAGILANILCYYTEDSMELSMLVGSREEVVKLRQKIDKLTEGN